MTDPLRHAKHWQFEATDAPAPAPYSSAAARVALHSSPEGTCVRCMSCSCRALVGKLSELMAADGSRRPEPDAALELDTRFWC